MYLKRGRVHERCVYDGEVGGTSSLKEVVFLLFSTIFTGAWVNFTKQLEKHNKIEGYFSHQKWWRNISYGNSKMPLRNRNCIFGCIQITHKYIFSETNTYFYSWSKTPFLFEPIKISFHTQSTLLLQNVICLFFHIKRSKRCCNKVMYMYLLPHSLHKSSFRSGKNNAVLVNAFPDSGWISSESALPNSFRVEFK